MGQEKTHMDYAYELDIAVKPESRVPVLDREFASFTGAGVPLFSLGGGYYRYALIDILARFHARRGYYVVETPMIANALLYKVSGHLEFYRQNMYLFKIEDHDFAIKPMNCPYHILLFMHELARYRNKVPLPFKVFEAGRVHRYEPSGSIYGLLRVRGFTQDDAHIITPGEQAVEVVYNVFEEMKILMENLFHLEITGETVFLRLSLSKRDEIGKEFMGTREQWEKAESILEEAARMIADKYGVRYYKEEGEAAFYGPKIDIVMKVVEGNIEKEWQLGTIQFDFNLPKRFRLYELVKEIYGIEDIYIIHRALLGSIERFLGVYLDYYKGRLPFVLAPVQFAIVKILTGDAETDAKISGLAERLLEGLVRNGLRAGIIDTTKVSISRDVRKAETTVKPAVLVYIGKKEVEEGTLMVRPYNHRKRSRDKLVIEYREPEDALEGLLKIAESLERPVTEISGYAPRIPGVVNHYF
ncbi:MAG: hypothetical protein F7C34_03620 [Desulfurococcales archaeon]|nr:hypothetical protein [Desulfurococcales archaeon]